IYDENKIRRASFRPFITLWSYYDKIITHRIYQQNLIFPIGTNKPNKVICLSNPSSSMEFRVLATADLPDLHFTGDSQCLPLYRYDAKGAQHDNITVWGLMQFRNHYGDQTITREDIFHYT